jgi:hypothetical protein
MLTDAGSAFAAWDAQWFLSIAATGYHADPLVPIGDDGYYDFAFFPLWPLLVRVASIGFLPLEWTAVIAANVLWVAAMVIGVVVASVVSIAPAHAARPVRSGTILVPARPGVTWTADWPGCGGTPECLVWLQACTEPASEELGVTSSVVDVRRLAGSSKRRTFAVVDRPSPSLTSGVTVEFWDRSCRPLRFDDGRTMRDVWSRSTFRIPRSAAWMTVTAPCPWLCTSFSGVALGWELR